MIKILVIVPYAESLGEFNNTITLEQTHDIQIDTTHIYGTPPKELVENWKYDIIVSRGITYQALNKLLPTVHMVEIGMSGFDVAAAIAGAKEQYEAKKIAVLTPRSVLQSMEQMEKLSGVSLLLYDIENEADILTSLQKAQQNGVDAVIGGLTVCKLCDERGINKIHIKSGTGAIEQAIINASHTAKSILLERAKTETMQSILNNAKDAIIAINTKGKITAINNKACRDLKIPVSQNPAGQNLSDFYTYTAETEQCLISGTEQESLRTLDEKTFLVNNKPILVDGQCVGMLVTLQNTEKISEAETKIRKELSAKGLTAKYAFSNIIGSSKAIHDCVSIAQKYSRVNSNVLLTGETGTGKELFAQSIHTASPRSTEPFVAINCATLPENLLESELFGYTEGTFSGASRGGKMGLFELAHKGTLFLDEIGELPPNLQAKLLRVLQEREIRRLGDIKNIPINVRVISATNSNIQEKINQGQFRADLFYRLNLLSLQLPPLRERPTDIPEIVSYFIGSLACEYGRPTPILTQNAQKLLMEHPWHGNARELRNICERLIILNESNCIGEEELSLINVHHLEQNAAQPETEVLDHLLQPRFTKAELARLLGVSRTTLWRKTKTTKQPSN